MEFRVRLPPTDTARRPARRERVATTDRRGSASGAGRAECERRAEAPAPYDAERRKGAGDREEWRGGATTAATAATAAAAAAATRIAATAAAAATAATAALSSFPAARLSRRRRERKSRIRRASRSSCRRQSCRQTAFPAGDPQNDVRAGLRWAPPPERSPGNNQIEFGPRSAAPD